MSNEPIIVVNGPSGPAVIVGCAYCQESGLQPGLQAFGIPCSKCDGSGKRAVKVQ